jgi:hypothetical protein
VALALGDMVVHHFEIGRTIGHAAVVARLATRVAVKPISRL